MKNRFWSDLLFSAAAVLIALNILMAFVATRIGRSPWEHLFWAVLLFVGMATTSPRK